MLFNINGKYLNAVHFQSSNKNKKPTSYRIPKKFGDQISDFQIISDKIWMVMTSDGWVGVYHNSSLNSIEVVFKSKFKLPKNEKDKGNKEKWVSLANYEDRPLAYAHSEIDGKASQLALLYVDLRFSLKVLHTINLLSLEIDEFRAMAVSQMDYLSMKESAPQSETFLTAICFSKEKSKIFTFMNKEEKIYELKHLRTESDISEVVCLKCINRKLMGSDIYGKVFAINYEKTVIISEDDGEDGEEDEDKLGKAGDYEVVSISSDEGREEPQF